MIDISQPALYSGLMLAGAAVVVGWALRRPIAPTLAKVAAPASLAAVAIFAPWMINAMQGTAKNVTFDALPHCIDIKAVVPNDTEQSATMLLNEDGVLRSYQILADDNIRDGLHEAIDALSKGDPAVLCKDERKDDGKKPPPGYVSNSTIGGKMKIDQSLFLRNLKGRS